jgi:hypothetical protein
MSEPTVEIDVACDSCGYNLRGLSGQWVRCPECGQQRSWESIESLRLQRDADTQSHALAREARLRDARISRAETGVQLCALAIGGFLLAGFFYLAAPDFFKGILRPMMLTSGLIWLVGLLTFHWTCRRFAGRWVAFLRHQMFAIPAVLLNIIAIAALCALAFTFFAALEGPPACFVAVTLAAPFAIWKLKPFAALSRRARAEIAILQEPATAVEEGLMKKNTSRGTGEVSNSGVARR